MKEVERAPGQPGTQLAATTGESLPRIIDVNAVIDNARFGPFHARVLFWCTLIIVFDGYDLVAFGVVLPLLMQQWQLSPVAAGALGSTALFGMMAGALVFGTLSDRVGRKKLIVCCVILFSAATALNGLATNPWQFGILRFIAGLGIGGVMPNVTALLTEYSPRRLRSFLVSIMFSGYAVGGMLCAGLGIWMIPAFGWPMMFFVAGLPLLVLPLIIRYLPETISFLLRQNRDGTVRAILLAIDPARAGAPSDLLVLPDKAAKAPVLQLFREGRGASTLMFWVAFFMCLLMVYALGSWLPKLMSMAGYGLGSSLAFLMVLNLGAIVGAIGGGRLADQFSPRTVLVVFFGIATLSLSLLGFECPIGVLYGLVALAGATTIGSQTLLYAFAAQFYPAAIRSTGVGWASGIGRNGAILGPVLGGALLALALPHPLNFVVFAIPGLIAVVAVFHISREASAMAAAAPHAPVVSISNG